MEQSQIVSSTNNTQYNKQFLAPWNLLKNAVESKRTNYQTRTQWQQVAHKQIAYIGSIAMIHNSFGAVNTSCSRSHWWLIATHHFSKRHSRRSLIDWCSDPSEFGINISMRELFSVTRFQCTSIWTCNIGNSQSEPIAHWCIENFNFEHYLSSASKILHEGSLCSPFFCTSSDRMPMYNWTNNCSTYSLNVAQIGMSTTNRTGVWSEYKVIE